MIIRLVHQHHNPADDTRTLGNGKVTHFGVSFGGNFSVMSALSGIVYAAVDLGGPVIGWLDTQVAL